MSPGVKTGIQHQVAENVHGDRHVFVQNLGTEADALLGGECIHVAPDRIHLAGDFLSGAVPGAFEHHVLDKMRDAIQLPGLHPLNQS